MSPQQLANTLSSAIINPLLLLLFIGGLIVFVWGVVEFLSGLASGSDDKNKGKLHMLWGLIGLTIMVAAVTIIKIVVNTVGHGVTFPPQP